MTRIVYSRPSSASGPKNGRKRSWKKSRDVKLSTMKRVRKPRASGMPRYYVMLVQLTHWCRDRATHNEDGDGDIAIVDPYLLRIVPASDDIHEQERVR